MYSRSLKSTDTENATYISVDENKTVTGMEIGPMVPTREGAFMKIYIARR